MPEINIPQRPDRQPEKRNVQWKPPSALPEPPTDDPDWVFRWVATDVMGTPTPTNVLSRMEEGWEPVDAKEYPELVRGIRAVQAADGSIRMGGLMLCKMSRFTNDSRKAYYENMTQAQLGEARGMVEREAKPDPTMPLTNDTKIVGGNIAAYNKSRNVGKFGSVT